MKDPNDVIDIDDMDVLEIVDEETGDTLFVDYEVVDEEEAFPLSQAPLELDWDNF
jgi:hypothetical protein